MSFTLHAIHHCTSLTTIDDRSDPHGRCTFWLAPRGLCTYEGVAPMADVSQRLLARGRSIPTVHIRQDSFLRGRNPRCSRLRRSPPLLECLCAQLHLTTISTLITAWLRITEVSSTLQTAVEAWQRGSRGNFYHTCHGYACMVLRLLAWLHRSFNPTPNSRTALAGWSRSTAHTRASHTCCGVYKIQKDALLQFSSPVTPFTSNHLLNHNLSQATFSKSSKRSLNRL